MGNRAETKMQDGSLIQTVSGRRIDPLDPDPSQIDIGDIACALANQCRFGGHCEEFYSVAQHAAIVSDLLFDLRQEPVAGLWGLLHDAGEAYLVDLPHPLKHRSALGDLYREAEERLQQTIVRRFRLPENPPPELKRLDRALLATERRQFMVGGWQWPELRGVEPLNLEIKPWRPGRARREWLERYQRFERRRQRAEQAGVSAGEEAP